MKRTLQKRHKQQCSGQGLLEVIVAIGITIASIVTTVALIMSTLIVSGVSQQQIIAINLAREGIEVVRGMRDTNWLKMDSGIANARWNAGLADEASKDYTAIPTFSEDEGTWTIEFAPDDLGASETLLWINNNGLYNQFLGSAPGYRQMPNYRRLLTLYPICRDQSNVETSEEIMSVGQDCDMLDNRDYVGQDFSAVGVEVRSNVRWTEHGKTHTTELIDTLYDWKA